ncbi:MAG: response regulator, partial [Nodosilinea sp.]
PFEQKELIEAIKAAMVKARKPRRTPRTASAAATTQAAGGGEVSAAEFQALQGQVKQLQGEVAMLKGQLVKMLAFIKQKLK